MFACFEFALPLANLLFNLFGDKIDGGVQITLGIDGKKIRPRDGKAHGTGKLFIVRHEVIMLQSDSRINRPSVEMLKFIQSAEDMVLEGLECKSRCVSKV